jgi:hypothetical protein
MRVGNSPTSLTVAPPTANRSAVGRAERSGLTELNEPPASGLGDRELLFFELSQSGPVRASRVVHPVLRLDSSHSVQSNLFERLLGVVQGGEKLLGRGLDLDHRRTLSVLPRFAVVTAL